MKECGDWCRLKFADRVDVGRDRRWMSGSMRLALRRYAVMVKSVISATGKILQKEEMIERKSGTAVVSLW
jgi:hypothetical protein